MPEIEIKYNPAENLKIFRKYFAYKKRSELKKLPLKTILGAGLLIMLVGILLNVYFWVYLGGCVIAALIAFLLVFLMRFKAAVQKFENEMEKHKELYAGMVFGFNEEEIIRKTEHAQQSLKWSAITRYEENEGDLYLYYSGNALFDIISKSLVGESNYETFRQLLKDKRT